jgi:hypothetical protein
MAFGPGGNQQPADVGQAADRLRRRQEPTVQHDDHDEKSITAVEDEKI